MNQIRCIFVALIISVGLSILIFITNTKIDRKINGLQYLTEPIDTYSTLSLPLLTQGNNFKAKIIRYECVADVCGGGILGAYVWSLIVNRRFEMNIQHPCELNNILTWNEVNWYISKKDLDKEGSLNLTTFRIYAIQSKYMRKLLKKEDIRQYKSDIDVIVIISNLDWIHPLSQNYKVQDRIRELGFNPDKFKMPYLFRYLYKKMFKLTPAMEQKYETFLKRAKPTLDSQLICAQYRVHYSKRENTMLFWNFINRTFVKRVQEQKYKIFVTTDEEDVEKEAIKVFGVDKIVTIDGMFYHMNFGDISSSNCSNIEKVILDFHALQNCDMALISESGFGKLGVWNRDEPGKDLFIFKKINEKFKFMRLDLDDPNVIV